MPRRNVWITLIAIVVSFACFDRMVQQRYSRPFSQAMAFVRDHYYYYSEDGKSRKNPAGDPAVNERDLFEAALDGIGQNLDPNSGYVRPSAFEVFNEEVQQNFAGIGVQVSTLNQEEGVMVLSPIYESPAFVAGIRAGDKIVEIEREPVKSLFEKEAAKEGGSTEDLFSRLVRGEIGTKVMLGIERAGNDGIIEFEVERNSVPIESVVGGFRGKEGKWQFVLQNDPTVGYLRLKNFYRNSAEEIRKAISETDEVKGWIIDLRGNPGGLLTSGVEICDMFLEEGVIVQTRRRDKRVDDSYEAERGNEILSSEIPLVILVDRLSASASEILAAALEDHGRAVIGGERSYGKGTVQQVFQLEHGQSALRLTIATFWRPSEKNIHRDLDNQGNPVNDEWGVIPKESLAVEQTEEERFLWELIQRDKEYIVFSDDHPLVATKPIEAILEDVLLDFEEADREEIGALLKDYKDEALQKATRYLQGKGTSTKKTQEKWFQ
ncbi:MAG: S41 family peptidase [Pirellulaceae bacterium]|nr:S41 family peptidase [Pirellulaceae bacterium]